MEKPTYPLEAEQANENILKPKRKQSLTDEQIEAKRAHMRKISLERIAKAKLANETKIEEKENKILERLAKVETKKAEIRKVKETIAPPPVTPRAQPKRASKKVVVQEDTDSEDYEDDGSSSEEEVIYVAKKSKKISQSKSIIKPKREEKPVAVQETPKTIIKFL